MDDNAIDIKESKLPIEIKDKDEIKKWEDKISHNIQGAEGDVNERKKTYQKRRNFIAGKQEEYTNIVGLTKKSKKGHADQIVNYVGKSADKICLAVGNSPPNIKIMPDDRVDEIEGVKAQAREDFIDRVMWKNKFWKQGYKRAVINQVDIGDFAIKVYWDSSLKEIKITQAEKMENLIVGWRGDDGLEYDWVAHVQNMSIAFIEDEWGIKVDASDLPNKGGTASGMHGDEYNGTYGDKTSDTKNTQPMATVVEYCTDKVYAITINDKLVQFVRHEWGFNPWVIGHSKHLPGQHWSKSYIDDLMSPQIELNEVRNDERDFIRTASNAKYVAKNMNDFDPESIIPGSGQVIFVEGDGDFQGLNQSVNTYPVDTYVATTKSFIHDMLVPEVGFGSGGSDSGRSRAIDYQSILDVVDDLRDAWELVLDGVLERIQILGNKYLSANYWQNKAGEFEVFMSEYDWSDVMPITQSDKIVDVLNKFQMGLPFETCFEELGYRDPQAIIEKMKHEAGDPDLVAYRSKMYQTLDGGIEGQQKAQGAAMAATTPGAPSVNTPTPTLVSSQNQGSERTLPASTVGSTSSFSSPKGFIDQTKQNLLAQGK